MLPRRLAIFLLGAWIGCSILVVVIVLQNPSAAGLLASSPLDAARPLIDRLGASEAQILLKHFANEQSRAYLNNWELAQMVLTLVMLATLVFSGPRLALPVVLTLLMCGLVLFQHFWITPDLLFYGRQADFVRQEASFSLESQLWTLTRMYGAAEAIKLVCGGILTSYFFAAQSGGRVHKSRRSSEAAGVPPAA
jgi:hypothetical protein